MTSDAIDDLPQLAAELVLAYASRHEVAPADLPALFARFHQALADLGKEPAPEPVLQPAVPIRASIKPDYLVCLEDGRKLKTLKRHLRARYGMSPADYREKWKLPPDYPMVAPAYAATRRAIARKTGFGQTPAAPVAAAAPTAAPKPPAALKQAVAKAVKSKPAAPEPMAPKAAKPEPAPKVAAPAPRAAVAPQAVLAAQAPASPRSDAPAQPARRKLLKPLFSRDAEPVRAEGPRAVAAPAPSGEGVQGFEVALGLLRQAISRRRCVRTTYNKRIVTLAPHLVFTRHDELYLRAVTVEQEGRKPREWKLGTFKLAGLGPVSPSLTPFVYFADYKAEAAQTADIVCALAQG